jgi:hypothetical protein
VTNFLLALEPNNVLVLIVEFVSCHLMASKILRHLRFLGNLCTPGLILCNLCVCVGVVDVR